MLLILLVGFLKIGGGEGHLKLDNAKIVGEGELIKFFFEFILGIIRKDTMV